MPGRRSRSDEDGVDTQRDQNVHPPLVAGGHLLEIVDRRGRPGHADLGRTVERLAGLGRGRQDLPHVLKRVQARRREGVGPEDDVEPGDMVEIRPVERNGADIARVGGSAHGLFGKPLEEALRLLGHGRLAKRLRDASGPRRRPGWPAGGGSSSATASRPSRRTEINSRVIDQGHGRTQLADREVAADRRWRR